MPCKSLSTFSLILIISFNIYGSYNQYIYPYQQPSYSDYGTLGLLQMPNSRFREEGTLAFTWSRNQPYMRGGIVAYPFDWFEIMYKYTDINDQLYGPKSFSGGQSKKDKGFDVKFRLLQESKIKPSISFGFRDFGGTNRFQSEYIVASKWFNNIDVTMGLAWGVMAGGALSYKNPFIYLSDGFNTRTPGSGMGGQFATMSWLRGKKAALFGGIEWHIPNAKGHRLKIELDSNNYENMDLPLEGDRALPTRSHVNIGYTIPYSENIQFNLGFIRGNTLQFGFSLAIPLGKKNPLITKSDTPKEVNNANIIKRVNQSNKDFLYRTSLRDLRLESIYLQSATLEGNTFHVNYSQSKYYHATQALGRTVRILDQISPENISYFIISEENGPFVNFQAKVSRASFVQNLKYDDYQTAFNNIEFSQPNINQKNSEFNPLAKYPIFSYSFGPALRSHIGGPDGFALGQIFLRGDAQFVFNKKNSITSSIGIGIYDTFDQLKLPSNSILPHVRTEIVNYLKGGRDWNIIRLQFDNIDKLSDNIYRRFSLGIFEEMFSGVGGEILFRPLKSNYALGIDLYRVFQRDFDGEFGLLGYSTTTGHMTFYLEEPKTGILLRLIGGRYLARDSGITLDFSRRFSSGLSMGVFASKTDISVEEFGEGSFDKGFYFSMPIDLFFQNNSKAVTGFGMRPITRDGAAKLITGYDLWGVSNSGSLNTLARSREFIYD